jgi:hypothetical protein
VIPSAAIVSIASKAKKPGVTSPNRMTVKHAAHVEVPAFESVTVIDRSPTAAFDVTEILTVSSDELFRVKEFTVIPVPEKLIVVPTSNPDPVIVMLRCDAPRAA